MSRCVQMFCWYCVYTVEQKSIKQIKIYVIFEVAPFALMTALHTLDILSTSFMS